MYRKLLGLVLISMGAGSLVIADVRKAAGRAASPFDWPQWQGPGRTAVSHETGLLKKWPKEGPKLVWKADQLGGGYSGPAVAAGQIFGLSFRGQDEVVWALDEKTGKELWKTRIAEAKEARMKQGREGSRGTPNVDGDVLYALGQN